MLTTRSLAFVPGVRPALAAGLTATFLMLGSVGLARADLVSIVDPPGLAEIDEEIGNLSELNFEALGAVVNDHENDTGPQAANAPFSIGDVDVTGIYGWIQRCANYSGHRSSFTGSCDQGTSGTWVLTRNVGGTNFLRFDFTPPAGKVVRAVGLAYLARDNRWGEIHLTATVRFADGATLSDDIILDGDGDGLPNGKDAFVGFEDDGDHGGIISLEAVGVNTNGSSSYYWNGWDDIGVVTEDCQACGRSGDRVTVCHVPSGNPDAARTLCLGPDEAAEHFAHGDDCGPCADSL